MAKLSFRIEAEWEKVQKLREEIERLKRSIGNTDAVQNPVAFNKLNSKLQQTSKELGNVTGRIAQTSATIETDFRQKIYAATQNVDKFTEEIMKQKSMVFNQASALRKLKTAYASFDKNSYQGSVLKKRIQDVTAVLYEDKKNLFYLTQEQAKARLSVKKLRDEYALLRKEGGGTADMMNMLTSKVKQMGTAVLGGMGLKELASRIISVRSEFESMETSLKVLLGGNQKRLNEIMGQIKEYALASPLNTKDMVGAVQMMTSFGIEAEKSIDFLKAIGDISMGDTGKFNSLALAFSQMSSAGKLMGQDLMQMVNAGFNPLEEIARKTGKSIGELKEEMSKGTISSKMVQDAFISATSAGGKFFGMSQEGAKTLNGQISMLQESFDMMFNEIGQKGEGVIMGTVKAGTYLVEYYEQVGKILEGVVVAYGSYKAALLVNIALERIHSLYCLAHARNIGILSAATSVLKEKYKALNITMLKNPYALVFAALVTIGYEMYKLSKQSDTASAAQKRLKDANNEVEKSTQIEISKLNGLRAELEQSKKGTDKWKSAKDAIISQYGQYDSKLAAEIDRTGTLTSSYNNLTTAIRKSVAARQLKQFYDSNMQETQDEIQSRRNAVYKKLKNKYSEQTANLLMMYFNEYVATGKGLDTKLKHNGKLTTVEGMFKNIGELEKITTGGAAYVGQGARVMFPQEIKQARELQVHSDKVVKDYIAMNNISDAEANETLYGIKPTEKGKTATTKNKKYWEDKKKEAQSKLDALSYIEAKGKKGQALKKKIASYDKYLSAYPISTNAGGHSGGRGHSGGASDIQEKKIVTPWGQSDEVAELATKGIQSYIDAMQEGYEKEKKQRDFNHVQELADLDKYKRDYLNKKRDYAKEKFEADPKNKGKSFDPLSVSLSDDENKRFDDMRKNIIKKQENEDKELQKKRADSFNSYLKLYGDMQERRLAIAKEYDEKIAKSQTEGERLSLKAEKMKALSDFDLKDMKESMNWEELFGELGNLSVRQLEGIKAKLREILQSDGLSVEDYKTTVEQIDRVNSAIIDEQDKQRSFFKFTTDYAKERRKLELDVADALKTQSGLLEKQKTLSNDVRAKKDKIWLMLSTMGVSYRGGIDISKNNDILDSVGKKYGVNSKQYKEVQEALDGLAGSTIKLNETNKKKLDADGKAITAQLRLAKLIEDFTSWLSGFIQGFEKINANIQELPELLEKLGVDGESDVGLAVQSFANASNNALGAMKDFESGNYIGAVSKGISAIGDFVDGSISLFAGHGNEKAMEEEIARLSSANKELSYSIDKLSEQIIKKDNTNEQSIDAYKKAVKAQEEWQSNQQKAIDNRAGEWTNTGYGWLKLSGKKSFNYFAKNASSWVWDSMNKALSEQGYTKQITSIGNRDNPNDFWNLSPEEMKAIRTYANEAWRELFSSEGHHNPEELVNEYIERAGSLDKLKDQLNEKLTGFSWEGFRNNYLSVLQDMKSDTNDFAKNINNILSKSILESLVNKKYNQRIKEIQNMVAKAAEDGTITVEEANTIRDANKNLSDDMLRDREQLISKGLLVDEQTKEQSASANGVSSITYEQASNIVALTTAGNISRDQIKDVLLSQKLSSIDLSLTGISLIGKDAVSIADETRTILANSYMELKEINENTGVSAKCLTQIDENIKSMNRLIKDKL